MEHRDENVFRWSKDNDYGIFPIDYSETELEPLLHKSSYKIEKYLLDNPVLQPILTDLLFAEGKMRRQSESNIPIPLEAVYFLCCFDELKIGNDISYEEFEELCNKLRKGISPACTDDKIFSTFYRHILFQNTSYCEVILKDLWEKELTPRFQRLKKLAGQTAFYGQIQVLIDCLQSLDRCTLNMELQPRIELPRQTPKAAVQSLLSQLLSERKKIQPDTQNIHAVYLVNNSQLASGQSMKDAFYELKRSSSGSSRDKILQDARKTYFNDLAKQIETKGTAIATSSLQLEEAYESIQNYLKSVDAHITDEALSNMVYQHCAQYCQRVVAFCSASPRFAPPKAQPSYIENLISFLVETRISSQLANYQENIQMLMYFSAFYTISFTEELQFLPYIAASPNTEPLNINSHWLFEQLYNFAEWFAKTWQFIYKDQSPVTYNESKVFICIDVAANHLFKEGKFVAGIFNKEDWAFKSPEEAYNILSHLLTLLDNPKPTYASSQYLEVITIAIIKKGTNS